MNVRPIMDFRMSRWPPCASLAARIDRRQRKFLACCLQTAPFPGEAADAIFLRKARVAGRLVARMGSWSQLHFKRVLSWQTHLERTRNSVTPVAQLISFHGAEWLQQRGLAMQSPSVDAGRTGTRLLPGRVAVRWHDGVRWAREHRHP